MKTIIVYIGLLIISGLIFIAYFNLSTLKKEKKVANKSIAANTTCNSGFTELYFYKDVVANFLRH
jgi:hypothetical protein